MQNGISEIYSELVMHPKEFDTLTKESNPTFKFEKQKVDLGNRERAQTTRVLKLDKRASSEGRRRLHHRMPTVVLSKFQQRFQLNNSPPHDHLLHGKSLRSSKPLFGATIKQHLQKQFQGSLNNIGSHRPAAKQLKIRGLNYKLGLHELYTKQGVHDHNLHTGFCDMNAQYREKRKEEAKSSKHIYLHRLVAGIADKVADKKLANVLATGAALDEA